MVRHLAQFSRARVPPWGQGCDWPPQTYRLARCVIVLNLVRGSAAMSPKGTGSTDGWMDG